MKKKKAEIDICKEVDNPIYDDGFYMPDKNNTWHVRIEKGHHFICERQEDAQLISMLVKICRKLDIKEI